MITRECETIGRASRTRRCCATRRRLQSIPPSPPPIQISPRYSRSAGPPSYSRRVLLLCCCCCGVVALLIQQVSPRQAPPVHWPIYTHPCTYHASGLPVTKGFKRRCFHLNHLLPGGLALSRGDTHRPVLRRRVLQPGQRLPRHGFGRGGAQQQQRRQQQRRTDTT